MAELGEGLSGYLDVQDATLRAPRLEAVSNIGIANTAPQHAFSVGSNLYVDTESSNVLTVDGNVVCEGVKVGLIEIIPSYDLAAVSNVGNVTQSTIQFANATTGFVTTANVEVGTANLFVDTANSRVGVGTNSPVSGLTVFRDIESSNSFITERVLFRETWPNGLNSLVGDLGTWVVTNLNQQGNPGITTTPDGYGIVAFNGTGASNGEFVSPAFDLSDYAIVDGTLQADDKRKTTTRVFMKFWLGTRQLDASNEVLQVQFSPDNGTTWYTVATSQDRLNDNRFTMVSADLSPYILETSTQAKIRFYLPWQSGAGDYMRIGRIWIHESDVPTNLGGIWLGAGGNIGIGTNAPIGKLDVRGAIMTPVVSYSSNQDAPYLIAGTSGYTGEATNWDTYGFQHRIKTNSSGVPRITVDTSQAGEAFSIVNNGNVGIGTTDPVGKLDVFSGSNSDDSLIYIRNPTNANTDKGAGIIFENMSGTNRFTLGRILALRTNSIGSFDSYLSFQPTVNGTAFEAMRIRESGNVGIGTDTPGQTLDVNGDFRCGNFHAIRTGGLAKFATRQVSGSNITNLSDQIRINGLRRAGWVRAHYSAGLAGGNGSLQHSAFIVVGFSVLGDGSIDYNVLSKVQHTTTNVSMSSNSSGYVTLSVNTGTNFGSYVTLYTEWFYGGGIYTTV